eukprot:59272-Chlamydomonas_euryale.AAC.8
MAAWALFARALASRLCTAVRSPARRWPPTRARSMQTSMAPASECCTTQRFGEAPLFDGAALPPAPPPATIIGTRVYASKRKLKTPVRITTAGLPRSPTRENGTASAGPPPEGTATPAVGDNLRPGVRSGRHSTAACRLPPHRDPVPDGCKAGVPAAPPAAPAAGTAAVPHLAPAAPESPITIISSGGSSDDDSVGAAAGALWALGGGGAEHAGGHGSVGAAGRGNDAGMAVCGTAATPAAPRTPRDAADAHNSSGPSRRNGHVISGKTERTISLLRLGQLLPGWEPPFAVKVGVRGVRAAGRTAAPCVAPAVCGHTGDPRAKLRLSTRLGGVEICAYGASTCSATANPRGYPPFQRNSKGRRWVRQTCSRW